MMMHLRHYRLVAGINELVLAEDREVLVWTLSTSLLPVGEVHIIILRQYHHRHRP